MTLRFARWKCGSGVSIASFDFPSGTLNLMNTHGAFPDPLFFSVRSALPSYFMDFPRLFPSPSASRHAFRASRTGLLTAILSTDIVPTLAFSFFFLSRQLFPHYIGTRIALIVAFFSISCYRLPCFALLSHLIIPASPSTHFWTSHISHMHNLPLTMCARPFLAQFTMNNDK